MQIVFDIGIILMAYLFGQCSWTQFCGSHYSDTDGTVAGWRL